MLKFSSTKKNLRSISFDIALVALLLSACLYFSVVAINGNHGVKKKAELELQVYEIKKKLRDLEHLAKNMETKVNKLKGAGLDLDLLDEQAREVLGLIRSDEIILEEKP